jgi:LAO/AO transport system kinase
MAAISTQAIRNGDRLALSRALTAVENDTPQARKILSELFPFTGHAHLIGITGAPGTGKSTLVNQLAKAVRQKHENDKTPKVAIVAVDPTSPFTGGALLGDRIRMQDLAGDKGIFIRSMASRGALGGLAHSTAAFATILDGAGFDVILIETVGAGQAEVNIAKLAHTVIVVEAPGMGDDIQAIKAGILEIADILVVNKSDRPGAENTARALKMMLEIAQGNPENLSVAGKHMRRAMIKDPSSPDAKPRGWETPVQLVTATEGIGVDELAEHIARHETYLKETGLWQIKEAYRLQQDLEALVEDMLISGWRQQLDDGQFERTLEAIINKNITPLEAAETLLKG